MQKHCIETDLCHCLQYPRVPLLPLGYLLPLRWMRQAQSLQLCRCQMLQVQLLAVLLIVAVTVGQQDRLKLCLHSPAHEGLAS